MFADLRGKHALVTGAGRGIGRACAIGLAEAGAIVTLVSRSEDELQEVASAIQQRHGTAHIHEADVTQKDEVEDVVAAAHRRGSLDVTVNSAGINRPGPTVELSDEAWNEVMAVNLTGTFFMCRAVARHLLEYGGAGRIVNISSQMGSVGYPGRAAYCASKHAVDGLTKALAVEWAPHGIAVNSVAPTFIETPLTATMLADETFREDVLRRIPLGRLGNLDEVVAPVLFLASDASSLITGHVLLADGGWVAW